MDGIDLGARAAQVRARADQLDDQAFDDRATRAVLAVEAAHADRGLVFVEALEAAVDQVAGVYRSERAAGRSLFDTWRLSLPQEMGAVR